MIKSGVCSAYLIFLFVAIKEWSLFLVLSLNDKSVIVVKLILLKLGQLIAECIQYIDKFIGGQHARIT